MNLLDCYKSANALIINKTLVLAAIMIFNSYHYKITTTAHLTAFRMTQVSHYKNNTHSLTH